MTTAATMPMPPMVGVPALAMWTWGPSSLICWPMLCLSSHRMRNGVDSTATHRATPPEVISEITAGRHPPRSPADATGEGRRASRRSSKRTDPPGPVLGGLVALAGDDDDVPGRGRPDGISDGPARSGSTTSSHPADAMPMPDRIWSMMAPGSSDRGLSEVSTTTSAQRAATAPISGRFPWSRSPPHPNRQITRPGPASSRAAARATSRPAGVWA